MHATSLQVRHHGTAGTAMTKVSKWMGHSSITITVDRYGHLVPGSARDDMARFEAYLSQ